MLNPAPLYRRAERALSHLNVFVAFLVIVLSTIAVAYVVAHTEQSPTLSDDIGAILPDPENEWTLVDAIYHFRRDKAIPLEKGGSLPFRTIWIRIDLTDQELGNSEVLALKSIRAKQAQVWSVRTTDGNHPVAESLEWEATRSGMSIVLPRAKTNRLEIYAQVEPDAINRVQLSIGSKSNVITQNFKFERTGGLLVGALLMVAFFSIVVAIFNRDPIFFLYAAWLLTTLRVAAYNGDWDPYWLSIPIAGESLQVFLRLSYIAHSLISLALFQALFIKELRANNLQKLIVFLQVITAAMCFPTLLLDATGSLKSLWALSAITIAAGFYILIKLAIKAPSKELLWYIGSWTVTLLGSIAQIAFSFGFDPSVLDFANSQTTAVGSALMLGVTLAQRMNTERQARISAQNSAITALQRFRQNYNSTPVGIFSMKLDGTLLEHNPTFGSMFVVDGRRGSKVGTNWSMLLSRDAMQRVSAQADGARMMDEEMAVRRIGDKKRWFHVRAVRKADRYEGWIEDISARKEAEDQLKFLVHHDSLTGLLNRRGFEVELQKATRAAGARVICLAYVDLDRFKLVNDLFGHAAGDQILRQMSARMREVIAPPNVPARVGGDEFVVVIDSLPLEAARALCERLRVALSDRAYHYQDKAFSVTASIGLIRVLDGMRAADALTASDRACAEAKRLGGGSVICFDSSSGELMDYLEEIKLVAGMKERLPIENFFTQLQPIVSLRNPRASLCYEVLIRMRDASGAVMPPSRFIPAAERNGLMTQIDRWVLRSTLEWLDAQTAHRGDLDFCTINLSGASLNDEKFLQDTIALIREHSQSTRKICFEITESVALYDLNTTRRFVDTVKSFGAMVALDDFGAGYTSFSYLKELPADLVKIDGNFIRDVNSNPANFAITRAVVELAHELGMGCVAEWAENAEIVRSLIQLRIDYAQGYGLCRPIERERILAVSNSAALIGDLATADLVYGRGTAAVESVWGAALPI
ncbi:MAG: EAL domain-containing protein [Burkholderiaceae bacterium]|jgi:diguanylate cyclase (GGDEF)-like protein|nr:EAL domain-containing protein [Burkholderiaceae bacterium]